MEIIHFLDDIGQPYSCSQWGNTGSIGIPPIVDDGTENMIFNWFNNPNGSGVYPLIIFINHTMEIVNIMGSSPSLTMANIIIEAMLESLLPGCMNETACNYNSDATADDGSCTYLDCAGVCGGTTVVDCAGVCGGTTVVDCAGVCGGSSNITDGDCDCNENVLDECGVCGGAGPNSGYDCEGNQLSIYNGIIPDKFDIISIYPNPFNPVVHINFDIPWSGITYVDILNITGAHIKTLHSDFLHSGSHELSWNPKSMPSGVYFISLKSGDQSLTEKGVLLK